MSGGPTSWDAEELPPRLEVVPSGRLVGELAAPGSKSVTNRLLLMALLADGTSTLRGALDADDTDAMLAVVRGLGGDARWSEGASVEDLPTLVVEGVGGRPAPRDGDGTVVDCRLSGTSIRFGMAVAALSRQPVVLTGSSPLLRRPLGALADALRALGATVEDADGLPPVRVHGGLAGGEVVVDVTGSSQFASAVLLAAPYADRDVVVRTSGEHAGAYVALTAQGMRDRGAMVVDLDADGRPLDDDAAPITAAGWAVTAGRGYVAGDVLVEHDASAAAHLWALAVATGGEVTLTNVGPTLQPDAAILGVLEAMGAVVDNDGARVTVAGPDRPLPLGEVDLGALPDQSTTVAALAALADGPTTITGVEVVRGHETDRLAALATELRKVGARVEEHPDGLTVDGRATRGGAVLGTHHDHRLAMAFASVGARVPGVVVDDPACVAKTFPGFFTAMTALGAELRPA